jgi:hypothetical protein
MNERRSYFRINESIALEYKIINEGHIETSTPEAFFPGTTPLRLYNELRKIDADNGLLLHQIRDSNRAIADYLLNINRKIDLIGQQVLQDQRPPPLAKTITQVNLSEGGIAFGSATPIKEGQLIALRLVFLPSNAGLAVMARIIRCAETAQHEYQIAAGFYQINDSQQQIIGQQIMRAQMAEKRQNKEPH